MMKMTNAQIKTLAKKANISMDGFGYGVDLDGGNPNIEKFAILIIRECARVCRSQPNIYAHKADRDNCAIAIEEQFGIEDTAEEFENWCKESDDGAAE